MMNWTAKGQLDIEECLSGGYFSMFSDFKSVDAYLSLKLLNSYESYSRSVEKPKDENNPSKVSY